MQKLCLPFQIGFVWIHDSTISHSSMSQSCCKNPTKSPALSNPLIRWKLGISFPPAGGSVLPKYPEPRALGLCAQFSEVQRQGRSRCNGLDGWEIWLPSPSFDGGALDRILECFKPGVRVLIPNSRHELCWIWKLNDFYNRSRYFGYVFGHFVASWIWTSIWTDFFSRFHAALLLTPAGSPNYRPSND